MCDEDYCKDCWASVYESPRPQTVESRLSDHILEMFRPRSRFVSIELRGYYEYLKYLVHDRCTYCNGFVRETISKKLYDGLEQCECFPCRRCKTWINRAVDDETTTLCLDGRCRIAIDGEAGSSASHEGEGEVAGADETGTDEA